MLQRSNWGPEGGGPKTREEGSLGQCAHKIFPQNFSKVFIPSCPIMPHNDYLTPPSACIIMMPIEPSG